MRVAGGVTRGRPGALVPAVRCEVLTAAGARLKSLAVRSARPLAFLRSHLPTAQHPEKSGAKARRGTETTNK